MATPTAAAPLAAEREFTHSELNRRLA